MGCKQMALWHTKQGHTRLAELLVSSFKLSVVQSLDLSVAADKIKGRLCAAVAFDSVIEKKHVAMMYSPVLKDVV